MNSNQFKAWLSQQGCTFETKSGGSGHLIARLGNQKPTCRCMAVTSNWVSDW